MSTVQSAARPSMATTGIGLSAWIKRHPIIAYFFLAFTGTWLFYSPILLSKRGLGFIDLPDGAAFALFIIATYTGPFLAAFVVTGATDGKAGVRQLLHRIVQWRVGFKWYILVLLGYPLFFLLGFAAVLGPAVVSSSLTQKWPLLLGFYLPQIPVGFFLPTLGEEVGWRGFALPRLQQQYGPIFASLILGILHGLWHLPAYFVQGMILPSGFDLIPFVGNTAGIIAATFIWTWLFNNTKGSILFATFAHATSNANTVTQLRMLSLSPSDSIAHPWFAFQVAGVVALIVIALTRGRLGYKSNRISQPASAQQVEI